MEQRFEPPLRKRGKLLEMGKPKLPSSQKMSAVEKFALLALGLVVFLMIWTLWGGCKHVPPANPLPEDQLIDPVVEKCRCPGLDLSKYKLIGIRKMGRALTWLEQCESDGYIKRTSKETGDVDASDAGVVCFGVPLVYFRLISDTDLSRVERDLVTCRSKMLIREIE
jgi:hypothetical protein